MSSPIRIVPVMVCPRERCQGIVATSEGEARRLAHRCLSCGYHWYEEIL